MLKPEIVILQNAVIECNKLINKTSETIRGINKVLKIKTDDITIIEAHKILRRERHSLQLHNQRINSVKGKLEQLIEDCHIGSSE